MSARIWISIVCVALAQGCGGDGGGAPAVCGDGVCQQGESSASCCKDCGCPGSESCIGNSCTAPMNVYVDMGTPPATPDMAMGAAALSGKLTCTASAGCGNGLSCIVIGPAATVGECLAPCTSAADCGVGRACIDGECFVACTTASNCVAGMTCANLDANGTVCVPSQWQLTATGDACSSSASCRSDDCAGSPAWCTVTCQADSDCVGGNNGANGRGLANSCVGASSGGNYCFPDCRSNADCSQFGAATCKSVVNVAGASVNVCSS
jgi:hypothetical protein